MPVPIDRYKVERSLWRASGPRRGLLRKKSSVYVAKLIGEYTYIEDAELVFTAANPKAGEMITLIDSLFKIRLDTKYG